MNRLYYYLDLEPLMVAQAPKGVLKGRGRVVANESSNPDASLGMSRLAQMQNYFDKTSMGYVGTDEDFQELFTNRSSSAETYLNNQLKVLAMSLGVNPEILSGEMTDETYKMFMTLIVQPLVQHFTEFMTSVIFTEEEYLSGSSVRQKMFQPTPYDLGLIDSQTLQYYGTFTGNLINGELGLPTDDPALDTHFGNLNQRPLNNEFIEAEKAKSTLEKRKAELTAELMELDHTLALETQRRVSVAGRGVISPDTGQMDGLVTDTEAKVGEESAAIQNAVEPQEAPQTNEERSVTNEE